MKMLRLALFLLVLTHSHHAASYPSSIVAVPTAAIKPSGTIGFSSAFSARVGPSYSPYNSEAGFEIGLVGDPEGAIVTGVRFGGIELGVDFLNADLLGTLNAYVKPLLNAKVLAITESRWSPSVAFGVMDVAPFQAGRSLNFVYAVMSKTFLSSPGSPGRSGRSYGRLTLGLGQVMNSFSVEKDPFASSNPVMLGTWPFGGGSKAALLAGYESPLFNRFSFALDYFGGVSEVGEAALMGNYAFVRNVIGGIGVSSDNGSPVIGIAVFGFIYAQTHLF